MLLTAFTGFILFTASCGGPAERIREKAAVQVSPSPTPGEREISGVFNVEGSAENGNNPYTGVLTIQPQGDPYGFRWTTTKGTRVGTGVQIGNAAAASFAATGGGDSCGVVLFKVDTIIGTLEGRRIRWGAKTYTLEKATREDGKGFPGKYRYTVGQNETDSFSGTLIIKKDGDGYDFEWKQDEKYGTVSQMVGFGIWHGSYAAVSFGGRQCSFALYNIQSNGNLDGNWGGQAAVTFGPETAKLK